MERHLQPLADAIQSGQKVTFFQGAGISTGAGIPDFRSPKTGLYANLAKLDLPYAEAVFDIDYFRENPRAFYTLASELFPGQFMPTKFHYMIKLFQDKKLLKRVYTQNIDTLERLAGVDDEYVVEAHGSFANCHCIDCSAEMSTETLKKEMRERKDGIPRCAECNGYIKPDIVFFGEALPERLFDKWDQDEDEVEVAFVAGTSLTVHPFAGLPESLGHSVTRLLINQEAVGSFKTSKRKNDFVVLDDCDKVLQALCELLGWEKELAELIAAGEKQFKRPDLSAEEESKKLAQEIKKEEEEADQKKESEKSGKEKEKLQENSPDQDKVDDKSQSTAKSHGDKSDTNAVRENDLDEELSKLKI